MAATTPRKAAARRNPPAAARRTSRAKLAAVPTPEPVDLLAEWETEEKSPVPIKVGDIKCDVLRGFSGTQALEFNRLSAAQNWVEVLKLITTGGEELWDYIGSLTPDYASAVLNKIIRLSELFEGNFIAPLPGYGMNPAGAQPSPESTTTTV